MKYKVLLVGSNKVMIGDFFQHLDLDFEMQTSSMRYGDIMSHIKYFKPHAIVFCMHKEGEERENVIMSLKSGLENHNVMLVLIGDQEDCDEFKSTSDGMGDLVLYKPISARSIGEKLIKFFDELFTQEETPNNDALQAVCNMADEMLREIEQGKADVSHDQNESVPAPQADPVVKKHILVVDDDPMMLKLIKEQLKDTYTIATAISGTIALKFLESKRTDLVLLDYEMPGENGGDVLEKIRDNPAISNLPVVFLTGMKDSEKVKRVMGLKPQGYLLKPIDNSKLITTIKNIIG